VRAAARSRADEAQAALGAAVAQGLPRRDKVTGWWRLVALMQWLLMLVMLAGLIWIGLILGFGESHAVHKAPSLISDVSLAPWLGVIIVALLLLGWLISSWCQNMVVLAADRERELAVQAIMSRIATVAGDLVLIPTGRELSDYERFRAELAAARDNLAPLRTAPSPAARRTERSWPLGRLGLFVDEYRSRLLAPMRRAATVAAQVRMSTANRPAPRGQGRRQQALTQGGLRVRRTVARLVSCTDQGILRD